VREEIVEDMLTVGWHFFRELTSINHPTSSNKNKRVPTKRQNEQVSNIDKVIEHLNKKQKVTTSALDTVEMLMLSHVKTIKTFSPRRLAIAKQQISNVFGNLEMDLIEENENYHGSHPTNQQGVDYRSNNDDVIHREDCDYPATTDQHVAYPTQTENTDTNNLSAENCTQNYTNLDNYPW